MASLPPHTYYTTRLAALQTRLARFQKRKKLLAWLRLLSFLAALAVLWILFPHSALMAIAGAVLFFSLFIFVVSRDLSNSREIENSLDLLAITEQEIAALQHRFTGFCEGNEWKPEQHAYANDLDLFGRASLYQFCNRTRSQQGNQLFAEWLLEPAEAGTILRRQEAVKELINLPEWRQQLQAYGKRNPITIKTQQNINHWLAEKNRFANFQPWLLVRFLFPACSFTVLALYAGGVIGQNRFLPLMLLFLTIAFFISRKIMPAYTKLNRITRELATLSESIGLIENSSFAAPLLQELKTCFNTTGTRASLKIKELKSILDRLDYRLNPVVYIPLSALLCWDLQQVIALEKWKAKNQEQVNNWFNALATLEALASLGNLGFNNPGWVFPAIKKEPAIFSAVDMGHPLIIPSKRVTNSFNSTGPGQLALITGSNMSGKSTFLRSAGINIVLAMMGAPVCATACFVSPMKVISSMRVSDNLEESTSTFYAELKKLKEIIEAVNSQQPVFLLLDEILRGTNSADRHTGSAALIQQLVLRDATGMIATHDLELAKLAETFRENIRNYHFDVQVAGEELYFDYQLKTGICKSMNASILMKKIGIDL